MSRRYRHRPNDAVFVVMLLDDSCQRTGNAHTVAAHEEVLIYAVFVRIHCTHGLGVLVAQLEYLGNLDAARTLQGSTALRAGIARHYERKVGPLVYLEIFAVLGTHKVEALFVCAHNPALNVFQVHIADNLDAFRKALRADGALMKACGLKFFVGKQGKAIYRALCLDFV